MGWGTGPHVFKGDSDAVTPVDKGEACICPEWPFCSWLDCRSDCPANDCNDVALLGHERDARWADTGQGEAPVDRKLHGNHTKDPSRIREAS